MKYFFFLLIILPVIALSESHFGMPAESNDIFDHENKSDDNEDDFDYSKVKVKVLHKPEKCEKQAKINDFLTLHFTFKWTDGPQITSTLERNVPIEIQLGTKMISPGLDHGLEGICIGEKRLILVPKDEKNMENLLKGAENHDQMEYEVELLEINPKMTSNTFRYLDFDGNKQISIQEAENLVKMFLNSVSTGLPGVDLNQLVSFFIAMHDKNDDQQISESEFEASISELSSRDEL